jgi:hypothetical protein
MNNARVKNCQFAFKCPKKWEDLTLTLFDRVRHCHGCQRDVFLCNTDAELAEAVRLNRCVAVELPREADYPSSGSVAHTVGVLDCGQDFHVDEDETRADSDPTHR